MPSTPLVDLGSLDLTRVVHPKAEIYSKLKHRGRFALLDGILVNDRASELVVAYKDLRTDDWWCEDHIPGRPIFPGMLMIEASAHLATFEFFVRRPEAQDAFIGFTAIDKARFRSIVEPPGRLHIAGRATRCRTNLFTFHAQGFVKEDLVFEAEVMGMVL